MYHQADQLGHLSADKKMQENLKELGFKWKIVVNDKYSGKRNTVFALKRPDSATQKESPIIFAGHQEPI